jgi:hypothetical protein
VLTGLGSQVTLWNRPCGFIAWLGGDIVVETWNNSVYGWWNILGLQPVGGSLL